MPPLGADRPFPRILLIDDDDISREVLAMMLEMHGFSIDSAEDGTQALALLNAADPAHEVILPEVILMDTQMPGLSGVALIQALREHSSARVVAISGSDPGDAIREAADGFLLKPIHAEELVRMLESSPAAEEPGDVLSVQAEASEEIQNGVLAAGSLIDTAVLGKLKAMMPAKAVEEIYVAVAGDLTTRLAALESAMGSSDADEVKRIAHAIKGGCAMVGLAGARDAASRLETSNLSETWPKELSDLHFALVALKGMLDDGLPW